ncbi:ABC transporter ATP-binding protein [Solibacillus sp. CAU 1738]|uniref:ABC transporter ATP-binding protein n=1 Tax=Solibacillus sp. CAU 1738 TaxID=3140363 RepID=UPI003260BDD3
MNAIEIIQLTKRFDTFALKDVSFTLEQGTVMGFVGENGAGKSTTIKCILNLLKKDAGNIFIFGKNHRKDETAWKEEIGVVFDDIYFPTMMTAKQIDRFLAKVYKNWDTTYFFHLLERFKVPDNKKIEKLSRGMKMKLSIAAALAHHPKLLILDEPTSGLDPIVRDEILDLFLDFMQQDDHSILFSSHITSDLEKIADTITFIHEGQILFSDNKDTLLFDYGIWQGTEVEALELPEQAIVARRPHAFGLEVLVKRADVNIAFELNKPSIEDLMLFFVKGEKYASTTN